MFPKYLQEFSVVEKLKKKYFKKESNAMKKRSIGISLCLVLVMLSIVITGCGSAPAAGQEEQTTQTGAVAKDIKMAISVKSLNNPFFREMAFGAKQAADDLGIDLTIVGMQKDGDVTGQVDQCETLIESGIDALLYTPQNSIGTAPIVEAANKKNIPVVTLNTKVEDAEVACAMYEDDVLVGTVLASNCAKDLGGKGRVIVLEGVAGSSVSEITTKAITDTLAQFPGIEVVASMNADFSQDKAQAVMTDLLQVNKNIDAVIAINNTMMAGAVVALEENNYTFGEGGVRTYCRTIDKAIKDLIIAGKVTGAYHGWAVIQGYSAVTMAMRALNGQIIPSDLQTQSPISWWTKDNISTLEPLIEEVTAFTFD